jgi:hypothetical protein
VDIPQEPKELPVSEFRIVNKPSVASDQGRLAEEWAQFDNLGLLKQLGVELRK